MSKAKRWWIIEDVVYHGQATTCDIEVVEASALAACEEKLEVERMRLAGCGVAAMMNTADSKKDRITKDNPYWSSSYGDVCSAVDREIRLRDKLLLAEGALVRIVRVSYSGAERNIALDALDQLKDLK